MTTFLARKFAVLLIACACALSVAPRSAGAAPGGEKARAQALLARGDKEFRDGKYEEALEYYQKAYLAFPSPKIFFPIAQAEEKLGRTLEALEHYDQLLEQSGDDLKPEVRERTKARMQALERKIAVVTLEVRPPGTLIIIDDVEMGQAPMDDPMRLPPGEHSYRFTFDGHQTVAKTVVLVAGDRVREVVTLSPLPGAPPARAVGPRGEQAVGPQARTSSSKKASVATWTAGGLGIGAITLSLWAVSEHGRYSDEDRSLDDRDAARSRGRVVSWVADGLWVGTLVTAGLAAYWYTQAGSKAASPSGREAQSFQLLPAVLPAAGAGLVLSGEF